MQLRKTLLLSTMLGFISATAFAAELPEYTLTIKDHTFTPTELEVPADTKFKLIVKNEDATAEEFESHQLKREKVIAGHGEAKILLGPLKAGEYKFMGEFHEDTAKGKIIVK